MKNVVAKSVEVKKLYGLSHYCDFNHRRRELALLSINSFQKDLAASNQLVRAMALRDDYKGAGCHGIRLLGQKCR